MSVFGRTIHVYDVRCTPIRSIFDTFKEARRHRDRSPHPTKARFTLTGVALRCDCLEQGAIYALEARELLNQQHQFAPLRSEVSSQPRHQLLDPIS